MKTSETEYYVNVFGYRRQMSDVEEVMTFESALPTSYEAAIEDIKEILQSWDGSRFSPIVRYLFSYTSKGKERLCPSTIEEIEEWEEEDAEHGESSVDLLADYHRKVL